MNTNELLNFLPGDLDCLFKTLEIQFLDIQTTIECGFTLKRVPDMIRTYSQTHRTDKYSKHSSTIWSVWLHG